MIKIYRHARHFFLRLRLILRLIQQSFTVDSIVRTAHYLFLLLKPIPSFTYKHRSSSQRAFRESNWIHGTNSTNNAPLVTKTRINISGINDLLLISKALFANMSLTYDTSPRFRLRWFNTAIIKRKRTRVLLNDQFKTTSERPKSSQRVGAKNKRMIEGEEG